MKRLKAFISVLLAFAVMLSFNITAFAEEQTKIQTVELSQLSYTYTGNRIVPQFKVYDENGLIVPNSEDNYIFYTYNSKNVGTATVKVVGKNNYQGSVSVDYTIKPRAISTASAQGTKLVLGKKPTVVLKYDGKTLQNGTDYTYTVSKYSKAGKSVTIKFVGKGNYFGTKTITKIVYPPTVTGLTSSNRTNNSFTLSWNSLKNKGVTNYKIYKCDEKGENRKLVVDTSKTTTTVKGYSAGQYCYLVARAYVTVDGTNYYSDYSKVFKTVTKPEKVVMTKAVKSKNKSKLNVSWDKAPCTGYQIKYSTDKSFKNNVKTVEVSGSSKTSKSISISKNNKTYYVRVRAFRRYKYNGKERTYYGDWSNKLSTEFSKVYASYKTAHVYNPNRTTNLKLACNAINGTILKPGEVFSFNQVVGIRSASKGYKPATIFTGSNSTAQSLGGGICQVASTLFNATLYANLGIVERHQHSQRVTYCPLGRDAAIFWGSEDYKFKNTSEYPIKINMVCKDGYVYCKLLVSSDVSPKDVTLKVQQSGKTFTLKRYVNGVCNYTTKSVY